MNDTQTLTLTNDYLFKLLLGSEENKVCLQDFLECVLDMPAGNVSFFCNVNSNNEHSTTFLLNKWICKI